MSQTERDFMQLAIAEARKCKPEDNRIHPKVGAVVVKDGKVLASAYRGEFEAGEHAEFTALEKKLSEVQVAGAAVYTTLEPCTVRKDPKVACTARLITRKVRRVVIGTLDPNPIITGRGQLALRSANIETALFPPDLMAELEDLNREFFRAQSSPDIRVPVQADFVANAIRRDLDDWYRVVNAIYWNRNFNRSSSDIFTHLVEVVGTLSLLASSKKKSGIKPETYVAKAIAWWLALCGKMGVISVEMLIWDKFPGVCAYCHRSPHDPDICSEEKLKFGGPRWDTLAAIGKERAHPSSLVDWQLMFSQVYPAQQTEDYGPSFGRLSEELGELAEAVRVFSAEPGYFLSEAADVFAWLMHVQNLIEQKQLVARRDRGRQLASLFANAYPDSCHDCGKRICACPPILDTTIGRIAHEVPEGRGTFGGQASRFMTPDVARTKFRLS